MKSTDPLNTLHAEVRSFRLYLQQELLRRCEKNPRYSLRAFSENLKINPATLSTILSGKRPITKRTIESIGAQLLLKPSEIESFCATVTTKHEAPQEEQKRSIDYAQLSLDTFTVISEWYHDAILELTHLRSFKADARWIAKVLGLSINEVNQAVERLCRLNLLDTSTRQWKDLSSANQIGTGYMDTSIPLRKYQKQILELSLEALENISREQRDHTSTTLTLKKSDLPELKNKIRKFRSELAAYLRKNKAEHDEVYQLAVSIFPISNIKRNRRA